MTPEQEQFRLECEARDWIRRIREEGHSRVSGHNRLQDILADIVYWRGQAAADELEAQINLELERQGAVA